MNVLQDSKDFTANISTNGVNITNLALGRSSSNFFSKIAQRERGHSVLFSAWDFGGQSIFHSTHRFFITDNALYVILYDMSKPETIERVKYGSLTLFSLYCATVNIICRYWLDQVGTKNNLAGSKPVIIVGTHADKLSKQEQATISAEVQRLYPISTPQHRRQQIHGHFVISVSQGMLC